MGGEDGAGDLGRTFVVSPFDGQEYNIIDVFWKDLLYSFQYLKLLVGSL